MGRLARRSGSRSIAFGGVAPPRRPLAWCYTTASTTDIEARAAGRLPKGAVCPIDVERLLSLIHISEPTRR
eukprot:1629588-Heterocapsa_arctica.AAC.1